MTIVTTAKPWRKVQVTSLELEKTDPNFKPDPWQKKVLEHLGNISLRTGRQVGKSETVGKKCAKLSIAYDNITILMIAAAQRQSSEIFQKTLKTLYRLNEEMLKLAGGYKQNKSLSFRQNEELRRKFEYDNGLFESMPTKTEFRLKNGTRVLSLPTGKSGAFVRCYTVDILIGDEAAYIPEPVWTAIRPMLATSQKMRGLGWTILLSTPFGKGGYYYNCCHDPDFMQIHVSSEDCSRISRDFLRKEKARLSKKEYAQEYLGEFVAEFNQFFSTALIKERMNFIDWNYKQMYDKTKKYALGVDLARYGEDENAFIIVELQPNTRNHLKAIYAATSERKSLTDTVGRIIHLNKLFNFNKIITDDGGLGAGVTDMLIEQLGKNKILGINNSKRTTETDKQKGIMKEDLYSNALTMMEGKIIDIVADLKLQRSLKDMTFEYTSHANLRIYGKYSHLSEAFVRACWFTKCKHLKLFIA